MDEFNLAEGIARFLPEIKVILELIALLSGGLSVYSAIRLKGLYSSLLYLISMLSLWFAWHSLTAALSLVILFSVCLLTYIEVNRGKLGNRGYTNQSVIMSQFIYNTLWTILSIGVIATFYLRITEINLALGG